MTEWWFSCGLVVVWFTRLGGHPPARIAALARAPFAPLRYAKGAVPLSSRPPLGSRPRIGVRGKLRGNDVLGYALRNAGEAMKAKVGIVMVAMAEVRRAVSGVVKWAMAPAIVQPMGIRPMARV